MFPLIAEAEGAAAESGAFAGAARNLSPQIAKHILSNNSQPAPEKPVAEVSSGHMAGY